MIDPRIEKLARLLIDYSIDLKRGQTLLIRSPAVAAPLVREVYRAAIRKGAFVETAIAVEGLNEIFFAEASGNQLDHVSEFARFRTRKIDAMVGIWAESNTRALTNSDPKKMARFAAANQAIQKIFMDRASSGDLKWTGTLWPTNASAQDAEMSLADYEEFVLKAGHLDASDPVAVWKAISRSQQGLVNALNKASEVRIVAEDTDITLGVKGRKWINCDGHENFPDGEVFTGPLETKVDGHIRFSFPAIHHGREVQGAQLEFKKGKVVSAKADKGQDFLRAMVDMDDGSCRLGELAMGTNYNIVDYTRNTLFDEKIGGTVHLAIGAGYPETGSKNQSGLHWDMVCDTRQGGKVYVDGKLIQENGRFLRKTFPQPPEARAGKSGRKKRS